MELLGIFFLRLLLLVLNFNKLIRRRSSYEFDGSQKGCHNPHELWSVGKSCRLANFINNKNAEFFPHFPATKILAKLSCQAFL